MFKLFFIVLIPWIILLENAFAQNLLGEHSHPTPPSDGRTLPPDHTDNFCSEKNSQVCSHIRFLSPINSSTKAEFIVHVLTPNEESAQNIKVDLWMDMGNGHGHGSSPVIVSPMDELNHFHVENARFLMRGQWFVRIYFSLNNEDHQTFIPITVAE